MSSNKTFYTVCFVIFCFLISYAYFKHNTIVENLAFKNTDSSIIIYIITLMDNPDRLKNVHTNLLNKYNEHPTFIFPAIKGKDLSDKDKQHYIAQGYVRPDYFSKFNVGQQGCALSHLSLLKNIANDGHPDKHYIIIEDDGYIDDQFDDLITKVIRESKNIDWDQIILHNDKELGVFPNVFHNKAGYLNKCKQCVGTVGYMVSKNRAKNILNQILPLKTTIDTNIELNVQKQFGLDDPVIHLKRDASGNAALKSTI